MCYTEYLHNILSQLPTDFCSPTQKADSRLAAELSFYCLSANFCCLESLISVFAILSTFVWSVFAE